MRHGRSLFAAGMLALVGALLVAVVAPDAWANEPKPWQLGMQTPASPTKEFIHHFHDFLLVIITVITLFVLGLLGYVVVRFSARNNPTPSKTTHNTLIEVVWTVVPVMILVVIAIPSFKLLYYADKTQQAEMTIKVIGNQWYWQYQYPDMGEFTVDSRMIEDKDLPKGGKRLLDVDNRLVLPVDTTVRILLVSNDVMHSWMVSSLGVQLYANPGRTNETWTKVTKEGVYYGQCNQICGVNHAYMPIAVEAVSKDAFKKWVEDAKKKFADNSGRTESRPMLAEARGAGEAGAAN